MPATYTQLPLTAADLLAAMQNVAAAASITFACFPASANDPNPAVVAVGVDIACPTVTNL